MASSDPTTCLIYECPKPAYCRGMCSSHYKRLLRHGDPLGGGTFRRAAGLSLSSIVERELGRATIEGESR